MWVLNLSSAVPVPAGGENSSQAFAGVCGVLRVQRPAADRSHHLRGHQKRYDYQSMPHWTVPFCIFRDDLQEAWLGRK